MFGLLEKIVKTGISVVSLPVTIAIDAVQLPLIAEDEEDSVTIETFKNIRENVEDIAIGDWE